MWPNGDFGGPVGSFEEPVPVPGVDPLAGDCSIIRLNKAWLPYIRGALSQLWLASTWDTDDAGLINVQQQVTNLIFAFNDLEPGDCSPQPQPIGIAESDYEMSICEQLRFNGGVLEGYCCGEWVPIQGQTPGGALGAPAQPGSGSGLPTPNGGQKEYCGDLGRGSWLLPATVSSGDTLLFSDLFGAWQDSRDLFWHCPDGFLFVLDVCGPTVPHGSPDPVPTGYHMQLIAEIDGSFYDILLTDSQGTPSVFTVPPGISNATVTIQGNTDDTDLINGSVQFCVRVTNNSLGTWEHTFNVNGGTFGWTVRDQGAFSPGVGFIDGTVVYGSTVFRGADIQLLAFPSRQLTRVRYLADSAPGLGAADIGISITAPGAYIHTEALQTGPFWYDTGVFAPTAATNVYIDNIVGQHNGSDPGGSCVISTIIINGLGVDPYP